jgi:hypothetical protein
MADRLLGTVGDFAPALEEAYGYCAQYLKDARYYLPIAYCLENLHCPSKCPMGVDCKNQNIKTEYVTQCMIDPVTNQPRCQETCKDVGAPWY